MKVLVTGANGFLGLRLVKRLLDTTDYDIRCFIRSDHNKSKIMDLCTIYGDRIEIQRGSLLNSIECKKAIKNIDILFHIAAATSGAPAEMFLNSSVATNRLLSELSANNRKCKIVFCSSFSVYRSASVRKDAIIDEKTLIENQPTLRDIYSLTKFHQEQTVIKYYNEKKLSITILRPGVIYGPGSTPISGRVGINLFGLFLLLGGRNILPLTYVDNCADAFIIASKNAEFNCDVYNIVDDDLISCKDFFGLYLKKVKHIPFIPLPFSLLLILSYISEKYYCFSKGQLPAIFTLYKTKSLWIGRNYSNDRLKSLGWRPEISTSVGLSKHFSFLRGHLDNIV